MGARGSQWTMPVCIQGTESMNARAVHSAEQALLFETGYGLFTIYLCSSGVKVEEVPSARDEDMRSEENSVPVGLYPDLFSFVPFPAARARTHTRCAGWAGSCWAGRIPARSCRLIRSLIWSRTTADGGVKALSACVFQRSVSQFLTAQKAFQIIGRDGGARLHHVDSRPQRGHFPDLWKFLADKMG